MPSLPILDQQVPEEHGRLGSIDEALQLIPDTSHPIQDAGVDNRHVEARVLIDEDEPMPLIEGRPQVLSNSATIPGINSIALSGTNRVSGEGLSSADHLALEHVRAAQPSQARVSSNKNAGRVRSGISFLRILSRRIRGRAVS